MSDAPVRLGLIGAGRWGRAFIATMAELPHIHLAGLASRNAASRRLAGRDCTVHAAWPDMLRADELDGVIVATPPATHAEIAAAALDKGLAVLVEKPLTLDLAQAEALTAQASGAIAQVDHIDLHSPAWRALRRRLPGIGRIGDIEGAWANRGPWRPDTPGRWDYGPHPLAICIDLLGAEPDRVNARPIVQGRGGELIEADLGWDGGATARLRFGNGAESRQRRFTVRGETGTLEYDDAAADKARLDGAPVRFAPEAPLAAVLARFAAAIRLGSPDSGDMGLALGVVRTLSRIDSALAASPR